MQLHVAGTGNGTSSAPIASIFNAPLLPPATSTPSNLPVDNYGVGIGNLEARAMHGTSSYTDSGFSHLTTSPACLGNSPSQNASLPEQFPAPTRVLCPDIDPLQPIDGSLSPDEILREGLGIGLGEDDAEISSDDDSDMINERIISTGQQGTVPHARSSHPPWLIAQFQKKLEESNRRSASGLPPLYDHHKTFWFPRPSSFFILAGRNVTPQDLYNVRWFLWDPECLVPDGIRCPNCPSKLTRHGSARLPRRCVDLDESFWIIGYRYICKQCRQIAAKNTGNAPKPSYTFMSWNTRILDQLPPHLRAEFPARLSHRSGLSISTTKLLRSCTQAGLATQHFADALRAQHLTRFDELHLQYLDAVFARRGLNEWRPMYKPFLPFEDRSDDGYYGFTPSAIWLRNIYDSLVEEHEPEIYQHMAMLTAEVCAIDHSHKASYSYCSFPLSTLTDYRLDHETDHEDQWCRDLRWLADSD